MFEAFDFGSFRKSLFNKNKVSTSGKDPKEPLGDFDELLEGLERLMKSSIFKDKFVKCEVADLHSKILKEFNFIRDTLVNLVAARDKIAKAIVNDRDLDDLGDEIRLMFESQQKLKYSAGKLYAYFEVIREFSDCKVPDKIMELIIMLGDIES